MESDKAKPRAPAVFAHLLCIETPQRADRQDARNIADDSGFADSRNAREQQDVGVRLCIAHEDYTDRNPLGAEPLRELPSRNLDVGQRPRRPLPAAPMQATKRTVEYNRALSATLADVECRRGIDLFEYDLFVLGQRIVADPAALPLFDSAPVLLGVRAWRRR